MTSLEDSLPYTLALWGLGEAVQMPHCLYNNHPLGLILINAGFDLSVMMAATVATSYLG